MAKRILVVDDDDFVRKTAVDLVESLGYWTATAINADDALQLVMSGGFDAILTDVIMPGMNGYQFAERIRAMKPNMPIICGTGYDNVVKDPRYCDALIRKPYRLATIASTLTSVFAG
jgi:CheY-like chemotaxis protein